MLQDKDTYTLTKIKQKTDLRNLFIKWKNFNYISALKYRSLYCSDEFSPEPMESSRFINQSLPLD